MRKACDFFMRKVVIAAIALISFLLFSSASGVLATQKKSPKHITALEIENIREGKVKAFDKDSKKMVEAKIIYHHRNGHTQGGPPGGGGSSCFAFIAKGTKWKTTEDYVLDPTNNDNLSTAYVTDVTATSFNTWDTEVATNIFGVQDTLSTVDGADTVAPDGKNEVMFGSIDGTGTIGVTIVWGFFTGPPSQREIVETDTVFDDDDFLWGDATVNANVMDYHNIATHEFGHSAGMGHPTDDCTEETMYRFGAIGETKRRDLNTGDIAGINDLY